MIFVRCTRKQFGQFKALDPAPAEPADERDERRRPGTAEGARDLGEEDDMGLRERPHRALQVYEGIAVSRPLERGGVVLLADMAHLVERQDRLIVERRPVIGLRAVGLVRRIPAPRGVILIRRILLVALA